MPLPIEIVLFVFLLTTAVVIAILEDLFAAAMITGVFSLLSAGLFTMMDAVDVAFTEATVGAGVATVFMLCTLSLTAKREYQQPTRILPFVVVGITGAALIFGTLDMPVEILMPSSIAICRRSSSRLKKELCSREMSMKLNRCNMVVGRRR